MAQSINPIVGDTSWHHFVRTPVPQGATHEELRIQNHLMYVYGRLVERPVGSDSRGRRVEMLDHLLEYMAQGNFPQNFYHPEIRRPCFIDDDGRLCAVAYLVAQTAGPAEAERINRSFRFHYLLDIKDSAFAAWQSASGLSMRELAMIQPTYYVPPPDAYRVKYSALFNRFGLKREGRGLLGWGTFCVYDNIDHPDHGPFFIADKGDKRYLFNERARAIPYSILGYKRSFQSVYLLSRAYELRALTVDRKGQLRIYDADRNLIWKTSYGRLVWQKDYAFVLRRNQKQGLYNWDGAELIPPKFDSIAMPHHIDENLLMVPVLERGEWRMYTKY